MVNQIIELILCAIAVAGEPTFLEELFSRTGTESSSPSLINFVPSADEQLENGQFVFYNKDPSISLTGYIPRRSSNMRVADNLFLRLLPHCGCSRCKFYCSCCSQATLDVLRIDTMACVKVEYLEKDIGFSYSVVVNDEVYVKKKVSVKDPPPVCFEIPTPLPRMRSSACITMYNIQVNGDHRIIHGCIKVSGTLLNMFNSDYDLGCFNVNVKEQFQSLQGSNDSHLAKRELDSDQMLLLERLKEYHINEELFNLNPFNKEENSSIINNTDFANSTENKNFTQTTNLKNETLRSDENISEYNSLNTTEYQPIDNKEYDDTLQQIRRLFSNVEDHDKSDVVAKKIEEVDTDELPFTYLNSHLT